MESIRFVNISKLTNEANTNNSRDGDRILATPWISTRGKGSFAAHPRDLVQALSYGHRTL